MLNFQNGLIVFGYSPIGIPLVRAVEHTGIRLPKLGQEHVQTTVLVLDSYITNDLSGRLVRLDRKGVNLAFNILTHRHLRGLKIRDRELLDVARHLCESDFVLEATRLADTTRSTRHTHSPYE